MRLLALLLATLPTLAFARLGETEAQLTARFGAPVSRQAEITLAQGKVLEFGTRLTYQQDDWRMICVVIDGRSTKETYAKSGEWTDDQITAVLNSNSQGAKWTDQSHATLRKNVRSWRRSDGGEASWQQNLSMTVAHPAYARAKSLAETKAKAAAGKVPRI